MAAAGPPPQGGAENEFDNFREAGEPPDGGGNASDGEQGGDHDAEAGDISPSHSMHSLDGPVKRSAMSDVVGPLCW